MNYLSTFESHTNIQQQFLVAIKMNELEVVKTLLTDDRINPAAIDHMAIRLASQHGNVVKLLLADPRVDPSINVNHLLHHASKEGQAEVVQLLLADPRVDPTAGDNQALKVARFYNRKEVIKILLADDRLDKLRLLQHNLDNKLLLDIMVEEGYTTDAEIEHYNNLKQHGFI